ncbi:MAG: DUF2169 domain-containing protein, partial [Gammaproteobacteria bacterium]|nr:DUF2169 domain-containing protein [Gammaproteobacteria bacterium]
MQIYKSLQLTCQHRVLTAYRRHIFSITTIIPFNLQSGEVLKEQDFWNVVSSELDPGVAFDSGVAKERHEFLINGVAFAPEAVPVTEFTVEAAVGTQAKQLTICGDRIWSGETMSPANPLITSALGYRNAFGGEGYPQNPLGRGFAPGVDEVRLPTVEYPQHRIRRRNDRPPPAGFGQIGADWQPRYSRVGSYRDPVESDFGFADDIDWLYFNDAAEDQWFEQPLRGDERFHFVNMHPEFARLRGEIPRFRARSFVNVATEESGHNSQTRFAEVMLTLDTLWFAPHKLMGALVAHGGIEVKDRYGDEITHLLLAFEHLSEPPRSREHYQKAMRERMDPELAMKYMLYSRDIIPDCVECLLESSQQPDPAMPQGYLGDNLDSFFAKTEAEVKEKLVTGLTQGQQKMQEQLAEVDMAKDFLLLQQKIERSEKELQALSALAIDSSQYQEALLQLNKSRQDLIAFEQKMQQMFLDADNRWSEAIERAKHPEKTRMDDDVAELQAFVDECFPKSKKYPDKLDIAAADFKKFEQLDERIETLMRNKMAMAKEEYLAGMSLLKCELQQAMERVRDAGVEIDLKMENTLSRLRQQSAAATSDIPLLSEAIVKVIAGQQQIKVYLEQTVLQLEQQLEDLNADVAEAVDRFDGKPVPMPLYRPATQELLQPMQEAMAASKLQLEQLNRELSSIASELEKKIRAIDAEIV